MTLFSKGLPEELLLVFSIAIWVLFFMIYLGNRKSKLNRWCFFAGMCFSMGVFKEYLYHSAFPYIMETFPNTLTETQALTVYSLLTAVPYYFAMPVSLILGYYYCHVNDRHPRLFPWLCGLTFLPAVLFGLFYPYTQTRYYQLNDPFFYRLVSIYDLTAGIILTVMMLRCLLKERHMEAFRPKILIAFLVLIPIWCTLMTTLPVQLFQLGSFAKLWQANLLAVCLLTGFYIYHLFHKGIFGNRLKHETFEWDSRIRAINESTQFIRHAIKNEMIKIEWCARNLAELEDAEHTRYADIIMSSSNHLKEYLEWPSKYSGEIHLDIKEYPLSLLLEENLRDMLRLYPDIRIFSHVDDSETLFCDRIHFYEIINNLFQNAADAMNRKGSIHIACLKDSKHKKTIVSIQDDGPGLNSQQLQKLFDAYYTTKNTNIHTGLGLYYCKNVMLKHKGSISAESIPGHGTVFLLTFPSIPPKRR